GCISDGMTVVAPKQPNVVDLPIGGGVQTGSNPGGSNTAGPGQGGVQNKTQSCTAAADAAQSACLQIAEKDVDNCLNQAQQIADQWCTSNVSKEGTSAANILSKLNSIPGCANKTLSAAYCATLVQSMIYWEDWETCREKMMSGVPVPTSILIKLTGGTSGIAAEASLQSTIKNAENNCYSEEASLQKDCRSQWIKAQATCYGKQQGTATNKPSASQYPTRGIPTNTVTGLRDPIGRGNGVLPAGGNGAATAKSLYDGFISSARLDAAQKAAFDLIVRDAGAAQSAAFKQHVLANMHTSLLSRVAATPALVPVFASATPSPTSPPGALFSGTMARIKAILTFSQYVAFNGNIGSYVLFMSALVTP